MSAKSFDQPGEIPWYDAKWTATIVGAIVCLTCEKMYVGSIVFRAEEHSGHVYRIVDVDVAKYINIGETK